MQIRFADTRPAGDFALVLPSAGVNRPGVQGLGEERSVVEAADLIRMAATILTSTGVRPSAHRSDLPSGRGRSAVRDR